MRPPPRPHRRRTPRDHGDKPAPCEDCGRNTRNWDDLRGCNQKDVRGRPGLPYTWPEGVDHEPAPDHKCHICWVPLGAYHHWMCSVEVCPWGEDHDNEQGDQLLYCGCME